MTVVKHKRNKGNDNIIPFIWKKGVSGNPKGRPKGKTLKDFAREYFACMSEEERIAYLKTLPTELVWRMGEGNPAQGIEGDPNKPLILQVSQETADLIHAINGETKNRTTE